MENSRRNINKNFNHSPTEGLSKSVYTMVDTQKQQKQSRKQILKILKDTKTRKSFWLKILVQLILVLQFINFIFTSAYSMIHISSGKVYTSALFDITKMENAIALMMIEIEYLSFYDTLTYKQKKDKKLEVVSSQIDAILELRNSLSDFYLYNQHLQDLLIVKEDKNSAEEGVIYSEVFERFMTKAINTHKKLKESGSSIDLNDSEIWYILENGSNGILQKLDSLKEESDFNFKNKYHFWTWVTYLNIGSQILLIIAFVVSCYFLLQYGNSRVVDLLQIFLKIDNKNVNKFTLNNENFLISLNSYKERVSIQQILDEDDDDESGMINRFGRRVKRFTNMKKINFKMLCFLVVLLGSILFLYITQMYLLYYGIKKTYNMEEPMTLGTSRYNKFTIQIFAEGSYKIDQTRKIKNKAALAFIIDNLSSLVITDDLYKQVREKLFFNFFRLFMKFKMKFLGQRHTRLSISRMYALYSLGIRIRSVQLRPKCYRGFL